MINNINELADKITAFVNYIVKEACERTSSGNYIFEKKDIEIACDVCNMDYNDYLKYIDFIEDELISREELLEFDMYGHIIDFMCALSYCPNLEWSQEDEIIFGSYEEFETRVVNPIEEKKSISELAKIGEDVINNYPDIAKEIQIKSLISSFAPGQVLCEETTQRYIYLKEKQEDEHCLCDIYNSDLSFSHKIFLRNEVIAREIYNGAFTYADNKKESFKRIYNKHKSLDSLIKECKEKKGKRDGDDGPDGPGDIAPARDEYEVEERSI